MSDVAPADLPSHHVTNLHIDALQKSYLWTTWLSWCLGAAVEPFTDCTISSLCEGRRSPCRSLR